jgi:putative acetyltransferase
MKIDIRLELEKDYRVVEEVTREAFWNFYVPGCNEHLILHKIRKSQDFIPALDFIAIADGRIVGNIVYTHSKIVKDNGKEEGVITFGPLSVLPEFQNKGIGRLLVNHSIVKAREIGYKAILIYGYPDYYKRFGFIGAVKFGISRSDGLFPRALQVLELYQGSLRGVKGKFFESPVFETTEEELIEFDKDFPSKEKFRTESQIKFEQMVNTMESNCL